MVNITKLFLLVGILLLPFGTRAQDIPDIGRLQRLPDAGRLQRELEQQPPAPQPQSETELNIKKPASPQLSKSSTSLLVNRFIISGNTHVKTAEIQPLLAKYEEKTNDFSSLQTLVAEITNLYQSKGYLTSRAFLPAQEITDGVVEIRILEGRLDLPGVSVTAPEDTRVDKEKIRTLLVTSIDEGEIVTKSELERGLLLVNDLPGISVQSTLIPGSSAGTSELLVDAIEDSLFSGSLEFDNYGSYYTGRLRGGGTIQVNSPTKVGDLLGARFINSGGGLNYLRGFYQRPVGPFGTQVGASLNWMDYSLGKEFNDDNIEGDSAIGSVYVTHPLIRSREKNLFILANLDLKRLQDEAAGITTKERDINVVKISLSGNQADRLFNFGTTNFNLTYTAGNLDLSDVAAALQIDQLTRQTDGTFHLVSGNISHTQYLTQNLSMSAEVRGQLAFNNLDSSEQFSLGGPFGVRAYPQGEAYGDSGYSISGELRREFSDVVPHHTLQAYLFFDYGRIWLHHDTWDQWNIGNLSLENSYPLSGAGLGLELANQGRYFIRVSYSTTIGSNDGVDANGNNSEGKDSDGQFWLQAVYWF